ncbi:MAG: 5-formyltetrahydrofolate cyclo-ligase [Clostridia bacterium]|nr:5-formyltetrahydrofolate cyclo-ligase [Clostridia bacterium]
MDKKEIRKELLNKRKEIPQEKKVIYDKEISKLITDSDYFKNADQVLVFASTDYEFDTRYIIERCRFLYKRVFYPVCIDNVGNMEFFKTESVGDLQYGMYHILEPKATCKKFIPKDNDIIIVPALSVDENGNRIGYGKGYYDKFLKDFNGVSICPCYEELMADTLPTDENDIKVNIIATQNQLKEVIL